MAPLRELSSCRGDFPALSRTLHGRPLVFLDGPGGTQVPRAVIDAVSAYYTTCNANTHGAFVTSRESDALLWQAREAVAAFLGARHASCISFGANMTTLAFSLAHALGRELQEGDGVVITQLDHEANRGPWLMLAERGVVVREVAVLQSGVLDEEDLAAKVNERTRLVAVGMASNALGTVNNVARARELARSAGAWLVLDAVHYAPHFPLDVEALGCDFLFCSAYKFYGPHVGILYARPGRLERLRTDRLRTQEEAVPYRIETGTLNHAAIAGVKAAVEYLASFGEGDGLRSQIVTAMERIGAHERTLASRYHEEVRGIGGVRVWGPDFSVPHRAPTVSITIDGVPAERAAQRLAELGIAVWDGHFYAARAVEALGLARRGGLLRAGVSMYTQAADIDRLLSGVAEIARGEG